MIADLTKRDYFLRVEPVTRATWKARGLKPMSALERNFFCAGGVERLVLEWRFRRQNLVCAREGMVLETVVPELAEMLYTAGSSGFNHSLVVPDVPATEARLLQDSLAPYESDGPGDTNEWNLFDAYMDKHPSSLDDSHSLSTMLSLWDTDEV